MNGVRAMARSGQNEEFDQFRYFHGNQLVRGQPFANSKNRFASLGPLSRALSEKAKPRLRLWQIVRF